jgi:beta-N-acetylhexosaminidase
VVGSLLGTRLTSAPPVQSKAQPQFSSNGPYVQLPLSADQISAVEHLPAHMKYQALARLYVSHMSLDEEIGQLLMVEYNQTNYSNDLDYMINSLHVGGVIMYAGQFQTLNQARGDIAHMQRRTAIPLFVATDEEGGNVERIGNIYGPRMSATRIGLTGDANVAAQQGLKVSQDLSALGVNVNLAPVVDVSQVSGGDVEGRTFGNTPDQVIKFAGAYLQAMQGNGTIGALKHFPGLGGATTDPHFGLPVVNSSRDEIYNVDLAPFKAFVQSPTQLLNPGMIMPTDVLLPAIDPKYPAELSPTFLTTILRQEFGYNGVIVTDALWMKGITDTWSVPEAAVLALLAGADMLLGADGVGQASAVINALKQAVQDGQVTKARLDESVVRIIALKMQYHVMPMSLPGM